MNANMMNQNNQRWQNALIHSNATIREVIKNLDETGLQIALVVNEDGVLLGTVTDGDIRRELLRSQDFHSHISEAMFQTPIVVTPEMGRDVVLHLMRANKIRQLPVVDDSGRVVGLHIWDDIVAPSRRSNVIIIMAGGYGKRLRPFTENCPKPMLPVCGKPILEHIIKKTIGEGFSNIIISLHYLGHVIKDYFNDGSKWGGNFKYLNEENPLGTAGAIALLDPAPDLPFIVTNGDVLTDIRFGEMLDFHLHHKADATMAVRQYEWQNPYGVVRTEGIRIIGLDEKPIHRTHVNAGIYVLNPSALSLLFKGQQCDMPTLFERLQEAGKQTIAYPMHEPWLDVGRPEDLKRANQAKD